MKSYRRWTATLLLGLALACLSVTYCLSSHSASAEPQRRNPRIHAALAALRDAKVELQEAPHDFRGHRKEALDAVNRAIDHLEIIREMER